MESLTAAEMAEEAGRLAPARAWPSALATTADAPASAAPDRAAPVPSAAIELVATRPGDATVAEVPDLKAAEMDEAAAIWEEATAWPEPFAETDDAP